MNKKVLTLCAGLLLAGSATAWGQVVITDQVTADNGAYKYQATTYAGFNQFVREDASMRTNGNFPKVSPFAIQTKYGAKPITELQHVDGQSDGRYFQFVVGSTNGSKGNKLNVSGKASGTEVLTMVWVNTAGELNNNGGVNPNGGTAVDGHYEIQIENVNNANVSSNPIRLDRTLWKVTANREGGTGTTLYYQLQNKASEMLLQLSAGPQDIIDDDGNGNYEVRLNISAGETKWRWAQGQVADASQKSGIINENCRVLKATLSAQSDDESTVHLARKVVTDASGTTITLGAIRINSNASIPATGIPFSDYLGEKGTTATFYPITFEAWEANPIILTADQINAELGNEDQLTSDKKTEGYFHFEFENDVEGGVNVMKASDFTAIGPKAGFDRVPGDTPDGYVRFAKKGTTDTFLRVDTAYHDADANGQYSLKLTVDKITWVREAVQKDGATVDSNGNLVKGGSVLDAQALYVDEAAPYTARVDAQLHRQANFRPIFYPATQSLRLQAEMMYRADKNDLKDGDAWWLQMAEDAMNNTNSNAKSFVANGAYMYIAKYAATPTLTLAGGNARGYYPSYTQIINFAGETVSQGLRLIHYANAWSKNGSTSLVERNGYAKHGSWDYTSYDDKTNDFMRWNAVGNVLNTNQYGAQEVVPNTATGALKWNILNSSNKPNVYVVDPAAATNTGNLEIVERGKANNEITNYATTTVAITSPYFALAHSNLVRISTLTGNHRELTADIHDIDDKEYNGLNTFITLGIVRTEPDLDEVAEIPEGFYYIQTAKQQSSDLVNPGDYRYEDLAATNATFTYWNADTKKWDRGTASTAKPSWSGLNSDVHANDRANVGNLVYSTDKKVIPSAQWYIEGNGGYYTIYNRESGRNWGTSHWWKTDEPGVYVNLATNTDGSSLNESYRDTIRITAVPAAELTDPYMGYLNLTQAEALADTVNFNMGMTMAGVSFSVTEGEDGTLVLSQAEGAKGDYKLERVLLLDKDNYSQETIPTDDFIYGFAPKAADNENEVDTTKMLHRAKYYIYKDDVSANTGDEETSIRTRKYITLNGGKYQLTAVKVSVDANGYTTNTEVDEIANTEGVKVRRQFYVKQISTEQPNQYVLVDPNVVTQTDNQTSSKTAYGARLFANQMTTEIQPSSLISDGYSNAYATSIFSIDKKQAYNYADIRPAGVDRDTIAIYSAYTGSDYLLSENANGLLESLDSRLNKNNALFLDTANISRPECPRFLLGLRSKDSVEISNLDDHNHHLFTDADYLINMVDSAANNKDYVYQNQPFNSTKYYRLGFVRARHHADGTLEFLNKENKTYDLTNNTLKNANDLNIATFAFRYANANRDEDALYYIETMYDHNTRGWLKTINHVQVVTNDIQEADRYGIDYEVEGAPTANEAITAEGAVSVVATDGAVVIKGAEGKNVVIATILGKVVANETVNSDNETIAVPAGIAVVSVDGESFKVVVK